MNKLVALSKSEELRDIEWAKCKKDPYYWLTNWAITLDTHDETSPEKPFPDKKYIKFIVDKWMEVNTLIIPKSRQMMVSWIFVALHLWVAQFHYGKLIFFQSKKADDANDLIKRAKIIWDNEPKFLKRYFRDGAFHELRLNPQAQGNAVYNLMAFPDIKTEIRGIPEGGEIVRMHTLSHMFSDEAAYQPEMLDAYTALKPTLSSKGKFTCVSTAEGNSWFEEAVFDKFEV